ncbi:hypothetical protein V8C34DRAFT_327744 [Trichoderma compactum]
MCDLLLHVQCLSRHLELLVRGTAEPLHRYPEDSTMPYAYGHAISDLIAVLGLFERVAIELRNFKNAPAHFQQLGAEIGLLQNAMRHAVRLIPQNDSHRETLERVRAISLAQIRQLTDCVQGIGDAQLTLIKTHSDALIKQTSTILSLVSAMPDTIADLKLITIMNDKKQSEQARMLEHGLAVVASHVGSLSQIGVKVSGALSLHTASMRRSVKRLLSLMRDVKALFVLLAAYSTDILQAIGEDTRALLNIASQMKKIIRAIEAIPLHLTLDIVRLDDALGESWALPVQACQSWESFYNLLSTVVYTKDRPGANRIRTMQFALAMANGGTELGEFNWAGAIKPGFHIEQAMVVTRAGASTENCLKCSDLNSRTPAKHHDKPCSACGRWVGRHKRIVEPVVSLLGIRANELPNATSPLGPELPSTQLDGDLHHVRRVQIREHSEPIHDVNTAKAILSTDSMDPAANTFPALRLIQDAQDSGNLALLETSTRHLEIAISSDSTAVDPWYLLAETSMLRQDYSQAYDYFRQATYRTQSPQIWISVATLYYRIHQFRDSLDAIAHSIRLNPYIYLLWYNLGILYDACNQVEDAYDAFQRCLELNPHLPDVRARFDVLVRYRKDEKNVPDDYKINNMVKCNLMAAVEQSDNMRGAEIVLNPIIDAENRK